MGVSDTSAGTVHGSIRTASFTSKDVVHSFNLPPSLPTLLSKMSFFPKSLPSSTQPYLNYPSPASRLIHIHSTFQTHKKSNRKPLHLQIIPPPRLHAQRPLL